jgi:hypothetical protein
VPLRVGDLVQNLQTIWLAAAHPCSVGQACRLVAYGAEGAQASVRLHRFSYGLVSLAAA